MLYVVRSVQQVVCSMKCVEEVPQKVSEDYAPPKIHSKKGAHKKNILMKLHSKAGGSKMYKLIFLLNYVFRGTCLRL